MRYREEKIPRPVRGLKNNGYIIGIAKTIHFNTITVGNVGAGLDSLHSFSLPAGSLAADGDYVKAEYSGIFAQNDNQKRVAVSFGGTSYIDTGGRDVDGNVADAGWVATGTIIRLSSTSVKVRGTIIAQFFDITSADVASGNTIGGYTFVFNRSITGLSNLNSNAITMLVQGEATANNDVVQNLSLIEVTQMS